MEKIHEKNMIAAFNQLKVYCTEEGLGLFSFATENRTRSDGQKVVKREFLLDIRRNFLTIKVE